MNKQLFFGALVISLIGALGIFVPANPQLKLSPSLADKMGRQIWQNECAGKKEGLTTWNQGEDFASLGIGHFIWYPEGKTQHFKQTFPELLSFFKSQGVLLPGWLEQSSGCPWQSREEFQAAQNQKPLQELRELLVERVDLQILFMINRLNKVLLVLLTHAPEHQKQLTYSFYRLAHTPGGLFVLLDYLNFKGEGTSSHESYKGQGWGLLQVLIKMHGVEPGQPAIEEFIAAAKQLLSLRVENGPQERGEERWLKGWHNRLDDYRRFFKVLDAEYNK